MIVVRADELPIRVSDDVVRVRQEVRAKATEIGLGLVDQTKIITAASELARNTLDYGGGGTVRIEIVLNGPKKGLRLTFEDHGPGIPDLQLALTDGYTTGGGLGLGLSGAKRLSNEFEIKSVVGEGTRVMIARWKEFGMRAVIVQEASQVAQARRVAGSTAKSLGFNEEEAGRVAIVVTELATNLIKHGGGGEILIGAYENAATRGIECLALDRGPGMANIDACLRDGHSTAGSAGTGLGAVMRGANFVDIFSKPGAGTAILARICQARAARPVSGATMRSGAVNIPMRGEEACGDAWCLRPHAAGFRLVVADGLGHGPIAAEAAHAAIRTFVAHEEKGPGVILEKMHGALRSTRGAAVAIADVDLRRRTLVFAGIGNIAGTLISGADTRRMVSHNGTVGHVARRVQEFTYPFEAAPLVILCSDGLGTRWTLDAYPGLAQQDPSLIAGVLYRDFSRGRDDVTVLVARGEAA